MDLDPTSGLSVTPDPTPFFRDFKDAKKIFFLITDTEVHYLQSEKFGFAKVLGLNPILQALQYFRKG
jgi:hypothetical protein